MDINKVAGLERLRPQRPVRAFVGLCSAVVLRDADIVLSEVNAAAASRFLLSQA
jgi:hypothetical protein